MTLVIPLVMASALQVTHTTMLPQAKPVARVAATTTTTTTAIMLGMRRCDRSEAAELASAFPKPPPLPVDVHPVKQPPKSLSPPLIQGAREGGRTGSTPIRQGPAGQRKRRDGPRAPGLQSRRCCLR